MFNEKVEELNTEIPEEFILSESDSNQLKLLMEKHNLEIPFEILKPIFEWTVYNRQFNANSIDLFSNHAFYMWIMKILMEYYKIDDDDDDEVDEKGFKNVKKSVKSVIEILDKIKN